MPGIDEKAVGPDPGPMGRLRSFGARLEQLLQIWTEKSSVILPVLLACYVSMVFVPIRRHLWHDELFTYYIAQASSIRGLFEELGRIDLNPPLVYLITRGWFYAVGTNETLARIPIAVAFLLSSLGFYVFLKPYLGKLWSAAFVLLIWCSPSFLYATELRPYALVLMFFSLVLVGWDRSGKWKRWVTLSCIATGVGGLALSHVFGILAVGPICFAELTRQIRARRIDSGMWACLLLPLVTILTYVPFFQQVETTVYPAIFQGSPHRLIVYFLHEAQGLWLPLVLSVVAASAASIFRFPRLRRVTMRPKREHVFLALALLSIPFLLNAVMMWRRAAFFDRYAIETSLTICALSVVAIAFLSGFGRIAGLSTAIMFLSVGVWVNIVKETAEQNKIAAQIPLSQFKPELPFVVANGVAFLELDHYENAGFLSRVYYLSDRTSAIRLSHATIFEALPVLKQYFPIRATVLPYSAFVKQYSHFVVFMREGWPEEWLQKKLVEDGATLTPISRWNEQYRIGGVVYEVRF